MGLPLSGKSELLQRILDLKGTAESAPPITTCVDVHEAVLCHNQFNGSYSWIKSTEDDPDLSTVPVISAALAKTITLSHNVPSLSSCLSSLISPGSVTEIFPDPNINQHFKAVLQNLQKLTVQLETNGSLDTVKVGSLTVFNLAKLNSRVSRVAFEIFCALTSRCKNLLILNLLNLERDTPDTFTAVTGNKPFSKDEHKVTKLESSMHHYVQAAHVASRTGCETRSVIMVGTHKDKLTQGRLKETKRHLEQITMGYAETVGIADTICSGMECINTKDNDDCERLQNRIVNLINHRQDFQCNIPIKYIFLHSYLQSLKQMFISKQRVVELAHICDIMDRDEIEEFLTIFNNIGSVMYSNDNEIPILNDYIILNPSDFINELNKLIYINTMSFSDKLELFKEVETTKMGFISDKMAMFLWPKEGDGRMTQANFFLTVLKQLKVILPSSDLQLEVSDGIIGGGKFYYMPLLRSECDAAEVIDDSNSLIIIHNSAVLSFRLLADTILQLQSSFGTTITFEPSPNHNTIYFKWHDSSQEHCEANIVICLLTDQVDISIKFPSQAPCTSTVTRIYSQLKTAFVQIFHQLGKQVKGLNYEFGFICPHNINSPIPQHATRNLSYISTKVHFVSFHPYVMEEQAFFCQTCKHLVPSEKLPWARLLWTKVACQELTRDTTNLEGKYAL